MYTGIEKHVRGEGLSIPCTWFTEHRQEHNRAITFWEAQPELSLG